MATIYQPLTDNDIKRIGVAETRKEYSKMASSMNKILNGELLFCHNCNTFHPASAFYVDKRFKSGFFPECKQELLLQATDYDKKNKTYTDNKEKTIKVFEKLNLPFIEPLYRSALTSTQIEEGERYRTTAYQHMVTMVKSLPQYKTLTFKDSEFEILFETSEEDTKIVQKTLKAAKKRFGNGYSHEDLMFLENEYQDWIKRYPCENKAQEVLYKQVCFIQLNIENAQKAGKDTKDLLKSLQDAMTSLQIKPSQSSSNSLTDAKTFGQLIAKWEDEWDGGRPIPEPDPEFQDVDKIGIYIDTFFKGHLAKMMGLKNGFSHLYDKFMSKYTVNQPQYDEDTDSEAIFDKIFGRDENDL